MTFEPIKKPIQKAWTSNLFSQTQTEVYILSRDTNLEKEPKFELAQTKGFVYLPPK